ncbi:MAG: carbohydrate kinase [Tetragenococcus halophilus]|nr:FGGY-family carbohydrate kinase [Tetragenococcus halophilus]MDN5809011.1 carbohydrate kinase [Staphylococcus equorum]MDN6270752.1 carbohydrate kinase [Tetragenococcus koreensis]MCF1602597.1 carbohydrate kinase [Tetragenococcus halophilus]MCF1676459.1 carbohydrate kinase [Tetragenococcus halophilus]MCF1685948.1 carbohydrate kinase [Tetragenococcus halophilus]
MTRYLMGIDNGGTSTKVAIYDLVGTEVEKCTIYTKVLTPYKYWTERDMEELKRVNFSAIQEVLAKSNVDPKDIIGISVTGHGNGLYLIGENGDIVRNGIISTDNRAHDVAEKWLSNEKYETEVRPRTYATIWSSQPASLLRWLDKNEPDIYSKTKYVFMVTDLIRYWLTNEPGFEISNASGTSLFNQDTENYDERVFTFFGIKKWLNKMPELIASSDKAGEITKEVSEKTGLVQGTPVAGGLMDISASALSTGLTNHNQLSIVTGTWSINQYIDSEISVVKDLFMTTDYPIKGEYLLTEASPTSGSNLTWFVETFLKDHSKLLEITENKDDIYDYCSKLVDTIRPWESNLIFYPFIFGSNSGVTNSTAGFIGVTKSTTIAEFINAIYEGVCFAHKAHVEKLIKINENVLNSPIRIAGGITNSEVWLQMFADVFQRPLELVNVKENGALGTSMAAGVMSGAFPDFKTATENMVEISRTIYPNSELAEVYDAKYQLYKKAVTDQTKVWNDIENTQLIKPKKEKVI